MLPPSLTEGVAVRVTVEVSRLSLIAVVAGVLLTTRLSKLPPSALSMLSATVLALLYTSLAVACTFTLALAWPAAMERL
ncbi:hypothetical protein PSRE111525_12455 [Pseudomonas reidholzensis]